MRVWPALVIALLAMGTASAVSAGDAPASVTQVATPDAFLGLETFPLWPGRAPLAQGDGQDETPTLTLFRPQPGTANGTAVIVAPGGGYTALAGILEGRQVADWFTSRGVTAFVLRYRIGAKARLPVPLLDGRRAMRFVRSNAARFGIAPDRIGMIGFSAGGHLAAMTAGDADAGAPGAADPVEQAGSRPNFVVLAYPWLNATVIGKDGKSQYCLFAQHNCTPADYVKFRPLDTVTSSFPPTFLYHTTTDALVRPDGSLAFYQALLDHKVPVEMHIFGKGQHGTGLGGADPALARWPELLEFWLRGQGLMDKAAAAK